MFIKIADLHPALLRAPSNLPVLNAGALSSTSRKWSGPMGNPFEVGIPRRRAAWLGTVAKRSRRRCKVDSTVGLGDDRLYETTTIQTLRLFLASSSVKTNGTKMRYCALLALFRWMGTRYRWRSRRPLRSTTWPRCWNTPAGRTWQRASRTAGRWWCGPRTPYGAATG